MKYIYIFSILLLIHFSVTAQTPVTVTCLITDQSSEATLTANASFNLFVNTKWKLDQMYIDSIAVDAATYAGQMLTVSYKSKVLIWSKMNGSIEEGKDFPYKLNFSPNYVSLRAISPTLPTTTFNCSLSKINLYNKYTNVLMYEYNISYLSASVLIIKSNQLDANGSGFTHKVEYRFVPITQP